LFISAIRPSTQLGGGTTMTRNYVQRVIENVRVYRVRFEDRTAVAAKTDARRDAGDERRTGGSGRTVRLRREIKISDLEHRLQLVSLFRQQ
jgi:hypothetical protein